MIKREKVVYWFPAVFWALIIFQFSANPVHPASEFFWQDFLIKKTAHVIEFAIFFILIYRAVKNTFNFPLKKIVLWTMVLLIFYAIADEYHQTFIIGRTGRLRDVLIDTGGGLLAWWIIWKLLPKAPKKLKKWAKNWQLI